MNRKIIFDLSKRIREEQKDVEFIRRKLQEAICDTDKHSDGYYKALLKEINLLISAHLIIDDSYVDDLEELKEITF